jgi:hypothetical protein
LVFHIKEQEQNEVYENRLLKKVFERKWEKKSDMPAEKLLQRSLMNYTHQIIRGIAYRFHWQVDA